MLRPFTAIDLKAYGLTFDLPINRIAIDEPVKSLSWEDESSLPRRCGRAFRRNCSPRCQGS